MTTHARSDRHFHCGTCGACCDAALLRSEGAALCPTHEAQVRTLLGWITLFTGIVAAATVANFIASVVIGLQAARPF